MTIADKAVLVTGANRGIGQALAAEAPQGAAKALERQNAALAQAASDAA
jgi:NAD(P)-dependent dehydrogenase (short-subunit alcohol dehydrogenase family)